MLRLIILVLIFLLPVAYFTIYRIMRKIYGKKIKPFSYVNLKAFVILLFAIFLIYTGIMIYRLDAKSGEEGKRTIYREGQLIQE